MVRVAFHKTQLKLFENLDYTLKDIISTILKPLEDYKKYRFPFSFEIVWVNGT